MTWGGVAAVAKPPVMPRGVEVGPYPWDCLRGILLEQMYIMIGGAEGAPHQVILSSLIENSSPPTNPGEVLPQPRAQP